MNLSNPLPETWQTITVAEDAFKITRKVIVRSPKHPNEVCQQALQISAPPAQILVKYLIINKLFPKTLRKIFL